MSKVKSLNPSEIQKHLNELQSGWRLNHQNHLYKKYSFKNFVDPMVFANKIAELSEEANHHPDLKISWGLCSVEIWTHDVNGISEKDFNLAFKIEKAFSSLKESK